jgi:hypothetical protein
MQDHFGHWLKDRIAELGIPTSHFVKLAGVSEPTLYRWFKDPAPRMRSYFFTKLAVALHVDRSEVVRQHHRASRRRKVGTSRPAASTSPLSVTQKTAGV